MPGFTYSFAFTNRYLSLLQLVSETEDDHWSEKRRQTSENIKLATEKAKQRKEEEEKKYEESRSKGMPENDMKMKVKKDDDRHVNSSPITVWDNNDSSNKSGGQSKI